MKTLIACYDGGHLVLSAQDAKCYRMNKGTIDTLHFNGGPEMTKIWQAEFTRLVQLAECMIPNAFVGIWNDVPVSSEAVAVSWDHDLLASADSGLDNPCEVTKLEFRKNNAEYMQNGLDPWVGVWPALLSRFGCE